MKENRLIFLIFLLIIVACKKGSNNYDSSADYPDSLFFFFEKANNDSIPFAERYAYNKKADSIISIKTNDSINRVYNFRVANRFFNMNAMEDYKQKVEKIIKNSNDAKDSVSLAKAYSYLGDYYGNKFKTEEAYDYNNEALKIYIRLKDKENVAKAFLNKALLQYNESDYLGAERSVFDALKSLRNSNNNEMISQSYNLLGLVYGELTEYKLSKEYYDKALSVLENIEIQSNIQSTATILNNIGLLLHKQSKDGEAINIYKTALNQKGLLIDRPIIFAMLTDNLAYSKFKKGDFTNLPDLFFKALKIRDSLEIIPGIILNNIHISEYYAFQKDTFKSINYARKAYNVAQSNKEKRDQLLTLKQLSKVDSKNAAKYSEEYFKINDSLKIAENKTRNKFARIEFETEELTIEKSKLEERQKTLIYIGLGLLVLGIFIFVIRFQAAKNRELRLVQEQQQANEEIYQLMLNQQNKIEEVRQAEKKRIAQELHDGVLGKLFGTRMNLGVLNSKHDDKAVADRVGYIDELKTLEQEIREISHDLNSEKTAVFNNFVVMVTNFFETQRTVCKAAIRFSIDPKIEWNTVDNMAKINFYRILQEAFQNINKHAEAKNVNVTFQKIDSLIDLEIEDDGVGFNYARKKKGIGLQNMNARIESSGGTMQIETEIGNGTLLQFELPLTPIQTINLSPDEKNSPVVNGR